MYMRLWWKDARQFWPIWAFLVLVAWSTQGLMHWLADPATRAAMMVPMAMGLACLYAFAAGAAAFAGERENGTLRLLDLLPAPRQVVWMGKVSFAVVSTIGLTAVLLATAALEGPPQPGAPWGMRGDAAMLMLGLLIFQAMAWGLFFSATLPSALLAAVAAIATTMVLRLVALDSWFLGAYRLAWELVPPSAAVAASMVVFLWGRRQRRLMPTAPRLPFAVRLRSPIEVSWKGRPRASAAAPAATPAPMVAARPPVIAAGAGPVDRPRPRSRVAELRALVWQAMREGRGTWLFLLALGLIGPLLFLLDAPLGRIDPLPFLFCNACVALVAGVSVFGLENRRRTYRFLVHHGARPGVVWLSKLMAWGIGLAVIWGPLAYLLQLRRPLIASHREEQAVLAAAVILPQFFAVGVLCGMAIPRGITAGVVALVVAIALGLGQAGLTATGMFPTWGLVVLPLAFLAVSWAWSGDWLLDRPAPGRYIRLLALLGAMLTSTLGGYTGWRAWGVPDVGPIPRPMAWVLASAPLPEDRDAAPLYREAARRLELAPPKGPGGSVSADSPQAPDLEKDHATFDLIRRAAARPECRFFDPERMTLMTRPDLQPIRWLARAVTDHARRRLEAGDLAAAWDDIAILLRMARHASEGATVTAALTGLSIERPALDLAERWANAPGQSPDRLRAALAAYRGLPTPTPPAEVIHGEGLLVERTIGLPIEDLQDLRAQMYGANRKVSTEELLLLDVMATPWERAHARRVNRRLTADAAGLAALEPWRRMRPSEAALEMHSFDQGRYTLMGLLGVNYWSYLQAEDRAEVERRALPYVMTLRAWELSHDGRGPGGFDELSPEETSSLPNDPYSGEHFRLTTFGVAFAANPKAEWPFATARDPHGMGEWLRSRWPDQTPMIYSVGPNRADDRGWPGSIHSPFGDIVFPVLPAPAGKK